MSSCHLSVNVLQVLRYDTEDASAGSPLDVDLAAQVAAFGGRYTTTDSTTALHYYMLAAALAGGGAKEQGRLLRELLVQSKDYGEAKDITAKDRYVVILVVPSLDCSWYHLRLTV